MFKNKYKSSTKKAPSLGRALEEWIDFPSGHTSSLTILFNSLILPFKWLLWISKGVAGLTLTESLRERLRDQSTSLGSVAALYLVITVSAFLTPPVPKFTSDQWLVDLYGILMFTSAVALTSYIILSLTVIYPLLESIPDFAALEADQNLALRWGGYELFAFYLGFQSLLLSLIVAAKVIYGFNVLYLTSSIFILLFCFSGFMTREFFIAIDPITSLHMGLCNAPHTLQRAINLAAALMNRHDSFLHHQNSREEYESVHYMESDPLSELKKRRLPIHEKATKLNAHAIVGFAGTMLKKKPGIEGRNATDDIHGKMNYSNDESKRENNSNNMNDVLEFVDNEYENDLNVSNRIGKQISGTDGANSNINNDRNNVTPEILSILSINTAASSTTKIPSLKDIFLEPKCLLLSQPSSTSSFSSRVLSKAKSTMTNDDCKYVYNILIKQGCRNTKQFILLLQCQKANDVNYDDGSSIGRRKCFIMCISLGIPALHAVIIMEYLKSFM